jgi:hypothetical protein
VVNDACPPFAKWLNIHPLIATILHGNLTVCPSYIIKTICAASNLIGKQSVIDDFVTRRLSFRVRVKDDLSFAVQFSKLPVVSLLDSRACL